MNLRTIKGVTALLKKAKKCQASAHVDLENSKRATCMEEEEEYIVINKKDKVNDLENIIIGNDRKSSASEKSSIFSEDTNKYRNDTFYNEDTSSLESSGVERGVTLKDRHVYLNKVKSQCPLPHPKNAINDKMIEKGFNQTSTTFPLGVQK